METQTDICGRFGGGSTGTAHTLSVRIYVPPEESEAGLTVSEGQTLLNSPEAHSARAAVNTLLLQRKVGEQLKGC